MTATTSPRALVVRWRRHRTSLLILGGLVAAVLVVLVGGGARPRTTAPLDPDNPAPDGARAVAEVLARQGVEVTVVRSADRLSAEVVTADTTVLVTSTDLLGRSTATRLVDQVGEADLVLAEPGPGALTALGIEATPWTVGPRRLSAGDCADPLLAGLQIAVDRATEYAGAEGCFPGERGPLVAGVAAGPARGYLLGAGSLLANGQVLGADNAAVALRLLGRHDRLVWYVPDPADLSGADGASLSTLLPPWVQPGLWTVGASVLAVIAWRGRRLGPLAAEPLPVVVRAVETTHGRARLYRKAGDRAHAARALRAAAAGRIAERLRLPARTPPAVLAPEVARRCGRPVAEVEALLDPKAPPPGDDRALIALAGSLAALDREVRRT